MEDDRPLRRVFSHLLSLDPPGREAHLRELEKLDPELHADVASLWKAHLQSERDLPEALPDVLPGLYLSDGATPIDHPLAAPRIDSTSPTAEALLESDLNRDTQQQYRIVELIGEGGMGQVFRAVQTAPVQRQVAIKIVRPGLRSSQVLARFRREQESLARMSHPNVAQVLGAGTTSDGRPFFVMDLVAGLGLLEYAERNALVLRERIELLLQVCDGVEHAHQKGIVHRDLKPSNVLVDEFGHCRVIDFGIAKALEPGWQNQTLTELGLPMGTPRYMSPEQAGRLPFDIDTRTDIYSLGVVLEELSRDSGTDRKAASSSGDDSDGSSRSLEAPMRTASELKSLDRARDERDPARWSSAEGRTAYVERDLAAIIERATAADPADRFASVSDLSADLRRFLDGDPVFSRRAGRWYRVRKLARKHRTAVGLGALAGTTLIAGTVTSTALYFQNRKALARVQEQQDELRVFSDRALLDYCVLEADRLWPVAPDLVPRLQAYLDGDCGVLAERLPAHRQKLASRRGGDYEQVLEELVRDLERFASSDPSTGVLADVRMRLAFAESVERRTVTEEAEAWARATNEIRDPAIHPVYRGLEIEPQAGLVPLGPDPHSGLWEFAHLQTGDLARRRPDGSLDVSETTGLVFVLLPGGVFRMGATLEPGPGHDPWSDISERPRHEVELRPFFISKFEMTRRQWEAVGAVALDFVEDQEGPMLPVREVSWREATRMMELLGLQLPTEAQWEYAARGGTDTAFPWGAASACVEGHANTADASLLRVDANRTWPKDPWDDGYPGPAPVGSFAPNAFGLHDVIGNVWEWTSDAFGSYAAPVAPGSGLRHVPVDEVDFRVGRGGCFTVTSLGSRAARRAWFPPENRGCFGLRPALALRSLEG